MAAAANNVKSWLLVKYAKQVETESKNGASNGTIESLSSRNNGEWKQISSLEGDGSIQLTLIENKHLMLSAGSQIQESFALVNTAQWLKIFCKGDSILFVVRNNKSLRRFRIKFANTGIKTGMDNCMDFVKNASPVLQIKVIPLTDDTSHSQIVEDSQSMLTTVPSPASQVMQDTSFERDNASVAKEGRSIAEIATKIVSNDQDVTSAATNLPTSDLSTLIRLCLSDPGFPNFVDKVEKELKTLTELK